MSKRVAQRVLKCSVLGLLLLLHVGCDRSPAHTTGDGSPAALSDGFSPSDANGLPSVSDTDDTAPIGQQAAPGHDPGSTGDDSGPTGTCPGTEGSTGCGPGAPSPTGCGPATPGSQPGTVGDDTSGTAVIPGVSDNITSNPGPDRCILPADLVEAENSRVITDVVDLELNCKLYLYRQGRTAEALACFFYFISGNPTTRKACDCACIPEASGG